MEIGVALPTMDTGVPGKQLLEWARQAEDRGFSSLAVLDRLVYGNDEPLVTLGAAAAVTERIKLMTAILIAPYRGNTALLAKQAATLHHLSGGRLVLGMAVGGREDDYTASGVRFGGRGERLDAMLDEMRRIWNGDEIGPPLPGGGPEVIIGGRAEAALRRVAARGDGYIGAAGPFEAFPQRAQAALKFWEEAGRPGRPRLIAQTYYSLGPSAEREAHEHLAGYYAFFGPRAGMMIDSALTSPGAVRDAVSRYAEAGCDELILIPCSADLRQLELLAETLEETLEETA